MISLRTLFGDDAEILYQRDFQLLLLANVLSPLGSALLAPILDSLIAPFGASAANIGLLISAFTAPAIVVIPIAGVLTDRYGRKPILVAALVLYGVAGVAIAFTTAFRVVLVLRALQGVAFGGLTPVLITGIGDLYESTQEATAQGFRFTGSGLVATAFPLLSSALVVVAWQYPFYVYAIALPIAAAVYLWFEEPSTVRDHSDRETESVRTQLRALWRLVTHPRVFASLVGRALPMFAWIGLITYNSIVVVRLLGGTPMQAGLVVSLGSLMYATTASQAGRVTSYFGSRLYPLVGATLSLGVGFALFHLAPSVPVALGGVVLVGGGLGFSLSLYRSIVTNLASEALRGSLVSVAESLGRTAATLTPVVMGGIVAVATPRVGLEAAVRVAGVAVAALCLVGGLGCVFVAERAPPLAREG